jgi:transcriptional regulator with XRE-family HTH domain
VQNDNPIYEIRNKNRVKAHLLFIQWIDSLCASKGITYYRIAKDCELPLNFLSNVKCGYHKYSVSIDVIILISSRYNYPFILSDYLA